MRIASVNLGKAEPLMVNGASTMTGIHKRPVAGPVRIGRLSAGDDAICSTRHHGGPDQAIYAYSSDDYAWWSERLGRPMIPGTFGENLTIDGLASDLYVGDRLLIGDVVLEATSPRIPCSTFSAHMRDPSFGMTFRRAVRPGTYFRVMNEGEVSAGDAVTLIDNPERQVSISELFQFSYDLSPEAADLQRFLLAPVAERMRTKIVNKLAGLQVPGT